MKQRTTIIFCIGRELLEGQVLDRNANFIASNLTQLGFHVRTIQVLDDVKAEMVAAFRWAIEQKPTFVLTTGGMGPGIHDITRACAAEAAGLERVLDERAREFLAASYRRLVAKGVVADAELTDERLEMARLPKGSVCFENTGGTAPGVSFLANKTRFFLLPGAPEELRRMFHQFVVPFVEKEAPAAFRESVQIDYPGGDESLISRVLGDLHRRHPAVVSRARLQGADQNVSIRIVMTVGGDESRGPAANDASALRRELAQASAELRARLGLELVRPEGRGETTEE